MAALVFDWFSSISTPMLGVILLIASLLTGYVGHQLRLRSDRDRKNTGAGLASDGQEGYVVSGVLGLLALMLGFTLAMAVDRFDARRVLVLDEANAIGTTYLRSQLLEEPHRSRMSQLLIDYTDNRIELAMAPRDEVPGLLVKNDQFLTDIWAATSAAFDTIKGLDFSSAFLETVNHTIDLDASRKAARLAHVPTEVLIVLAFYIIVTSGVLGYVLTGVRGQLAGSFLIALLTFSLSLIIDLERPTSGGILESQAPMELLLKSLKSQPPEVFDRWRTVENNPSTDNVGQAKAARR
jgi:hypothetical protein